ncbi:YbaK/EbsC family protein [Pasteurella multocida]|nr:YbaK/EbsC family protein [Pasteurella multocida]
MLPTANMLNLKKAAKAIAVKKVEMADKEFAQKSTGYLVGGISPLGQKRVLKTVIAQSALAFEHIFCFWWKTRLECGISTARLSQTAQC